MQKIKSYVLNSVNDVRKLCTEIENESKSPLAWIKYPQEVAKLKFEEEVKLENLGGGDFDRAEEIHGKYDALRNYEKNMNIIPLEQKDKRPEKKLIETRANKAKLWGEEALTAIEVRKDLSDTLAVRVKPYQKFTIGGDQACYLPLQSVIDEQVKIWYDGEDSSD